MRCGPLGERRRTRQQRPQCGTQCLNALWSSGRTKENAHNNGCSPASAAGRTLPLRSWYRFLRRKEKQPLRTVCANQTRWKCSAQGGGLADKCQPGRCEATGDSRTPLTTPAQRTKTRVKLGPPSCGGPVASLVKTASFVVINQAWELSSDPLISGVF